MNSKTQDVIRNTTFTPIETGFVHPSEEYVLCGWNTYENRHNYYAEFPIGSQIVGGFNTNTSLYAYWENKNKIQIIYHDNNCLVSISSDPNGYVTGVISGLQDSNEDLCATAHPNVGYAFWKWENGETENPLTYNTTTDYSNKAIMSSSPIILTFDGNGKTYGTMANQTFYYNIAQNLANNSYERKYTVSFDANGGSSNPESKTAAYSFSKWNNQSDGNGEISYDNGASVTNPNNSTGGSTTTYAQWNSGSIALPSCSKTGYSINGWHTQISQASKIGDAGDSYTPTTNITAYAHWTPNTYYVRFNKNSDGASGTMNNQTFTYDTPQNLCANGFSRTNYDFSGWALSSDGQIVYENEQQVSNLTTTSEGTVDLYAKWLSYCSGSVSFTGTSSSTLSAKVTITSPSGAIAYCNDVIMTNNRKTFTSDSSPTFKISKSGYGDWSETWDLSLKTGSDWSETKIFWASCYENQQKFIYTDIPTAGYLYVSHASPSEAGSQGWWVKYKIPITTYSWTTTKTS